MTRIGGAYRAGAVVNAMDQPRDASYIPMML